MEGVGIEREGLGGGFVQNTLYTSMKFSNNKNNYKKVLFEKIVLGKCCTWAYNCIFSDEIEFCCGNGSLQGCLNQLSQPHANLCKQWHY